MVTQWPPEQTRGIVLGIAKLTISSSESVKVSVIAIFRGETVHCSTNVKVISSTEPTVSL